MKVGQGEGIPRLHDSYEDPVIVLFENEKMKGIDKKEGPQEDESNAGDKSYSMHERARAGKPPDIKIRLPINHSIEDLTR